MVLWFCYVICSNDVHCRQGYELPCFCSSLLSIISAESNNIVSCKKHSMINLLCSNTWIYIITVFTILKTSNSILSILRSGYIVTATNCKRSHMNSEPHIDTGVHTYLAGISGLSCAAVHSQIASFEAS